MKSIKDLDKGKLAWVQRGRTKDELISNDETIGTLLWAKSWGSLAMGESAEGTRTFKRAGFLHPKITIREPRRDSKLYEVAVSWSGQAVIQLPIKLMFAWSPNFWHSTWTLEGSDGKEVVQIKLRGLGRVGGDVRLGKTSISAVDLSLLLLLGWYPIMLAFDDYAASTAAFVPIMAS
jgi:hypothetical protein